MVSIGGTANGLLCYICADQRACEDPETSQSAASLCYYKLNTDEEFFEAGHGNDFTVASIGGIACTTDLCNKPPKGVK